MSVAGRRDSTSLFFDDEKPVDVRDGAARRITGVTSLSKSQVSVMAKELDEAVEAFHA